MHDDQAIFDAVAAQRVAVADMLEGLSPQQLTTPSLCAGWSVHDVAAHLTLLWSVPMRRMAWHVMRARGSFPRAVDHLTRDLARQPIGQIIASLRTNAHNRAHPPGVPAAPLADVIVHGEDIRRPLGIVGDVPLPAVRIALDFVTSGRDRNTFLHRGRLHGLRLKATDQHWSWGSGDEIAGPSLPLLLGVMGRPIPLDELQGSVGVLAARL